MKRKWKKSEISSSRILPYSLQHARSFHAYLNIVIYSKPKIKAPKKTKQNKNCSWHCVFTHQISPHYKDKTSRSVTLHTDVFHSVLCTRAGHGASWDPREDHTPPWCYRHVNLHVHTSNNFSGHAKKKFTKSRMTAFISPFAQLN